MSTASAAAAAQGEIVASHLMGLPGQREKLTGLPWNHARSRRSCPLHRWLMDDEAAAELPARSSAKARLMRIPITSEWLFGGPHLNTAAVGWAGRETRADSPLYFFQS